LNKKKNFSPIINFQNIQPLNVKKKRFQKINKIVKCVSIFELKKSEYFENDDCKKIIKFYKKVCFFPIINFQNIQPGYLGKL
jgi:hypothetical protein